MSEDSNVDVETFIRLDSSHLFFIEVQKIFLH